MIQRPVSHLRHKFGGRRVRPTVEDTFWALSDMEDSRLSDMGLRRSDLFDLDTFKRRLR